MLLDSPAGALLRLAEKVTERIVTDAFAVWEVSSQDWSLLTEVDVLDVRRLALADEDRFPERAYVLARLGLLAAQVRWGQERESPWWLAADLFVELSRRLLESSADGSRLADAVAVVERQIAILDARIASLPRRRFVRRARQLVQQEEQERADTLQAAAWLILGPYLANFDKQPGMETLLAWLAPTAGLGRRPLRVGARSQSVDWIVHVSEDLSKESMPHPQEVTNRALAYLDAALATARGHVRGLCLVKKVRALDFRQALGEDGDDDEPRMLAAAREALGCLDAERAPEDRLMLIDLLVRYEVMQMPAILSDVLPLPLDSLKDRYSADRALVILIRLAVLSNNPSILADIEACAQVILPELSNKRTVLSFYDIIVHRLPDNRFRCVPGAIVTIATVDGLREEFSEIRHQHSPATAAATLLHVVAHVPAADAPEALELLRSVADVDPEFAARNRWLIHYLTVSIQRRHAALLADSDRLREALLVYQELSDDFTRFAVHLQFPDLLMELVREILARFRPGDGEEQGAIIVLMLFAIAPVVMVLRPSISHEHADFVHALGLALDQLLRSGNALGLDTFIHHCLFKGADLGILLDNRIRREIDGYARRLAEEISEREARHGPYVPARVDEFEENSDWVPDGLSTLYYATIGESAPSSEPEGSLESLRKAFDRAVTRSLLTADFGGDDSHTILSSREAALEMMRVQRKLPEDTVLISLFIGELEGTSTAEVPVNSACITMFTLTADSHDAYLLRLDALAGLFKVASRDQLISLHSLAIDVAELRLHINADGLSRPVTPHAADLLARYYFRLGGPPAQALTRWRAEGRKHLCIWPHGPLHYVPYHLLHHDGRPLAYDWIVTTIPSTAVIAHTSLAGKQRHIVFAGAVSSHPDFGLPQHAEVTEHVRQLAKQVRPSELLLDPDATPTSVLTAAERASHLHIAAHGSHDTEAAWFQCLYLNPDPHNDGRLFAYRVVQADLRGLDLVTLSACESAMGRYDTNDNLRGLPAAFLLAGAATVIGALWPVTAEVASLFYRELYTRINAGHGKRDAFHHAQCAARRLHPAYRDWGAFSYSGSWI
jgi:CHAT domain-containing protein